MRNYISKMQITHTQMHSRGKNGGNGGVVCRIVKGSYFLLLRLFD